MWSWKFKSVVNFLTFMCFFFTEVFVCLGLDMFYVNFQNIKMCFDLTSNNSNEILACLKGVVTKKAQVGCGQAVS